MAELLVCGPLTLLNEGFAKQAALLLDGIMFWEGFRSVPPEGVERIAADRDFLRERGVLKTGTFLGPPIGLRLDDGTLFEDTTTPEHHDFVVRPEAFAAVRQDLEHNKGLSSEVAILRAIAMAAWSDGTGRASVGLPDLGLLSGAQTERVLQVVLEQVPVPGPTTPWEEILEFREDPASRQALREFRAWVPFVAAQTLSVAEIRDRVADSLADYRHAVDAHISRQALASVSSALVAEAAVLNSLAAGDAIVAALSGIAAVAQIVATLGSGEVAHPGRALAYVLQTQKAFG